MQMTRSIRLRATLLISALLLAVIAVYGVLAYTETQRSAVAAARERLTASTGELASLLGNSVAQMTGPVDTLAAAPAIRAYLRAPGQATSAGALAALAAAEGDGNLLHLELTDAAGERLLALPEREPAGLTPEDREWLARSRGATVGSLRPMGDTVVFPIAAAVRDDGERLGYVVRWRRLGTTAQARQMIQELIGSDSRLHLVNASGDLWTDLRRPVRGPEGLRPREMEGVETFRLPGGVPVLAHGRVVPGTPWMVMIEFPLSMVSAGPRQALGRLMLFGLLLIVGGALLAWIVAHRLTGSITELATAAQGLTAGDYSRRVIVDRADELGTLGAAFNTMADSVATSHAELQRKVDQLAALEAEHRETRERLEHLTAASRTITYELRITDGAPRLEWITENVTRLLGYEMEEALAPGWWTSNLHPDHQDLPDRVWSRFGEEGEVTLEYRFRHADGRYVLIRDEQRVLANEGGEPDEVVGTLSDITGSRQLELAKEAAEAKNRAKSEFLSRISHELRTPMNAILGFAQLLAAELRDETNLDSAHQILRAGHHLLQLINEVLDIARVEAGEIALSVEPVAVDTVLRESIELVSGSADEGGVKLEVGSCGRYVRADQQRLKQVALNLLSNGIKYNRPGGSLRVTCEERPGERLRLSFTDTGRGIDAEAIARIFQPFERLGAEQTGVDGTGLGLSLSRGFTEAMGGEMGVESTPGVGSTFWIEFPLAQAPAEPSGGIAIPLSGGNGADVRTVLYIEDNPSNLALVDRLLRRRPDLRMIAAMQGRMGLQLARQHAPHVILLDVHLPDMKGHEVMRELQADDQLRHVPVIVISADATARQMQRLMTAGARDYLTKPFEVTRLMDAIDDALAGLPA